MAFFLAMGPLQVSLHEYLHEYEYRGKQDNSCYAFLPIVHIPPRLV